MNALEHNLNYNGFDEVSTSKKCRKWEKNSLIFKHCTTQHGYETYTLSLELNKFGFVQESFVIWEKYERCVEQLQEAIDWMEKCKNL